MTANRTLLLMGASLALILVFYILREHWGHVLGYLPYLILLACPLMHLIDMAVTTIGITDIE